MQFKIIKYLCCGVLIQMSSVVCAKTAQDQFDKSRGVSQFSLRKSVIAGGGQIISGAYQLRSAIGQSVTAQSTSATYQISAGFYQENRDLIYFNKFESNP